MNLDSNRLLMHVRIIGFSIIVFISASNAIIRIIL